MSNNSGLQAHLCEKLAEENSVTVSQVKYAELKLMYEDLRLEKANLLNLIELQKHEIKHLKRCLHEKNKKKQWIIDKSRELRKQRRELKNSTPKQ